MPGGIQAYADFTESFGRWIEQLRAAIWWLALAAGTALGIWAGASVWWRQRARTVLRQRTVVTLVPAEAFDPTVEEVERHAARLARVPSTGGWLPRRAAGVRVRLTCVDGKVAYRLEGPTRAAALLRLPAFPDVDVMDGGVRESEIPRIRFHGVPPVPPLDPEPAENTVGTAKGRK
ncbi:hypothetical protein [Streptomyces odonnellii]|uniref:hypothetical protein n=1 Tax=Streptomyces odonnellii TaxID=1417980 RepID=UPI000696C479|nr:hypothetical protein [Streptomyces odonnellii]